MKKKYLKYLYTFIGVALSVFITGFWGVSFSLRLIQEKYLEIQLNANKRHAESMARILEEEIERGAQIDNVLKRFQTSIQGTSTEEGFLCMFDINGINVCHPDSNFIGMNIKQDKSTVQRSDYKESRYEQLIKGGQSTGGLREDKANNYSEVVYLVPVQGTNWMLASHENVNELKTSISMFRERLIIGFSALGFLIALASAIVAREINRRYEAQIEDQKQEIEQNYIRLQELHEEVNIQKDAIEYQNQNITASITYAKRIQRAIMPRADIVEKHLPEHFILWQPKDIVSGDFYWFEEVEHEGGTLQIIVAADSTGHGVPGAFMSILGMSILNDIVRKGIFAANEILEELRKSIKSSLKQGEGSESTSDGMDVALITIDKTKKKLQYSGAYNPLYGFKKDEFVEYSATKNPIGIYIKEIPFQLHEIDLEQGDVFYIFSDGFYDQPGGLHGDRLKKRLFRDWLKEVHNLPMEEQKKVLKEKLDQWMSGFDQLDDILLMGIRI